jgi:hypothetical protein
MRTIDDLARDLKSAEAGNNGHAFHSVMAELFNHLGFSHYYDAYNISVKTWQGEPCKNVFLGESNILCSSLDQLEYVGQTLFSSNFPVESLNRVTKFIKDVKFFEIATLYGSFPNFKKGVYGHHAVMSSFDLGNNPNVRDFYDMQKIQILTSPTAIYDAVLSNGGVLKKDDRFYMNSKDVVDVIKSGPRTFYFALVRNDGS